MIWDGRKNLKNILFLLALATGGFIFQGQMLIMDGTGLNPTAVKSIGLVGRLNSPGFGHLQICLNVFAVGNEILKEEMNMHCKSH